MVNLKQVYAVCLLIFLSLFNISSFAQTKTFEYQWARSGYTESPWSDAAGACTYGAKQLEAEYAQLDPPWLFSFTGTSGDIPFLFCKFNVSMGKSGSSTTSDELRYRETAGGAGQCEMNAEPASGGGCQCKAGYVQKEGLGCVADQCKSKAGKVGVVNWTQGYSRTPDEGDTQAVGGVNRPPADGNICENGCMVSAQTSGAGVQYYVSQQPTSSGLYRRSVDFPTVALGTACTASEKAANSPTAPEPKCEGTVGQVNGKNVCVSTPTSPVTTTPMPAPESPPIAGNPAAGAKPESGEGSGTGSAGRTPDAGTGGNGGGSASAAVGGKGGTAGGTSAGTGNVKAPGTGEEQAACGAPGQPICDVKVSEKDMPEGKDSYKSATDQIKENADETKKGIEGAANIEAPSWSFSFQFPTGCAPYDTGIRGFVLDPCKYQSTIHDLMSMIWAAVTVFCIIGMVGRTIREA